MATTGNHSQKVDEVLAFIRERCITSQDGVELLAAALGAYLAGEVEAHYLQIDGMIRDSYVAATLSEMG